MLRRPGQLRNGDLAPAPVPPLLCCAAVWRPKLVDRYILVEVVQQTLLGLIVFAVIFLGNSVLRVIKEIPSGYQISLTDMLLLVGHTTGAVAAYLVPLAFLFGVLLAVSRLAGDGEIEAMRCNGIGLHRIAAPILVASLFVGVGMSYLMHEAEPRARRSLRALAERIVSRYSDLEAGRFYGMGPRIVHVTRRDLDGELRGVMIWDRSNDDRRFSVFASEGRFDFDPDTAIARFHLLNGDIHLEPSPVESATYRRIHFETFDYAFDLSRLLAEEAARLKLRDLRTTELYAALKNLRAGGKPEGLRSADPREYELQIQRRFALPVAPLVFGLIAVPLSIGRRRGARSAATMLCAGLGLAYYVLVSGAELLGEGTHIPAWLVFWIPNVVFLAAGGWLLARRA